DEDPGLNCADPAELGPTAKPLLHALRAVAQGDARTVKTSFKRFAECAAIAQSGEGLKFFALDTPVIYGQIDAMHGQPGWPRTQLWNCDLGARIFVCNPCFAC